MQTVLDATIEQYRRDLFFRDLDDGFARLRADPEAWEEEVSERRLWESTLMDGSSDLVAGRVK